MFTYTFSFECASYGWRESTYGTVVVLADSYREAFDTAFAMVFHGWDHVTRLSLEPF
jgi:hypothetical protein